MFDLRSRVHESLLNVYMKRHLLISTCLCDQWLSHVALLFLCANFVVFQQCHEVKDISLV